MCGINGFFNYSRAALSEEETLVARMNELTRHRGPDDTGVWYEKDNGIFLGHQRLSILDLSVNGHQPMASKRGTVIVYNGEIYNFKSLKADLDRQQFFSETDTEVLLYLYERDGEHCLDQLNGMFAFAIWDGDRQELFLARDRIGIRPLYYTSLNGVFAFSSEIKALLSLPWVTAQLDEEALYHFLTFNYALPPQTVFKHIHKFHPGYKMVVGEGGIRSYTAYWEVGYSDLGSTSRSELQELILSELTRSVENRMLSDVPVGAFLSGGVDSSAIVGRMTSATSRPIKTYSIGFQDAPSYDERAHARKISARFGTEHFEKVVTPEELVEFLPTVVDIYDEPLADPTSIPIYFLSQLAQENGTSVILTGDGADELFCGYRNYLRYLRLDPYHRLFSGLPPLLKRLATRLYGLSDKSSPAYEILSRAAKGQEVFWGAGGFKEVTKKTFLSHDFALRMRNLDSYSQVSTYRRLFESLGMKGRSINPVDWFCFLGLKVTLPNCYLYRADRLGLANSVELRVPFLDHHLVNLALSVPGIWKVRDGEPKYILKQALEGVLDRETLYREKQGFCVPLREWAQQGILDYVDRNLTTFCCETGLFNEHGLRAQVNQTRTGNDHYLFSLWNIYFLMLWFKKWML